MIVQLSLYCSFIIYHYNTYELDEIEKCVFNLWFKVTMAFEFFYAIVNSFFNVDSLKHFNIFLYNCTNHIKLVLFPI